MQEQTIRRIIPAAIAEKKTPKLVVCLRESGSGGGLKSQIHVVADGAKWIGLQAQEAFGDQHRMLCDFFHVSEYLAAAAKVITPSKSQHWRKTQQRRLKRGAADAVIAELAPHREPPDTPTELAPVN